MSEPTAEAVTGVHPTEVTEKAADKADDVTPNPHVPLESHAPEVKTDDGMEALRETVSGLASAVANLTDLVTGTVQPDETPHSVPWTHRGGRR